MGGFGEYFKKWLSSSGASEKDKPKKGRWAYAEEKGE